MSTTTSTTTSATTSAATTGPATLSIPPARASRPAQRGAASLLVTGLLCLATLLVAAFASREGVVEERSAANRLRSAQAFEAADAGIAWALARLNDSGRMGADCLPASATGSASARALWLRFQDLEGGIVPAAWNDAGTPAALHAACARRGDGWSCSCPATGLPTLPPAAGDEAAPAFDVSFAAGPRAGLVRVVAVGCVRRDAACALPALAAHEAVARVEAGFAFLPALRSAPAAALTVRGRFDAGTAAPGMHHPDAASGGLGLHAGGSVTGSQLRFSAAPGSPLAGVLVADDPVLAGLRDGALFARHFGMAASAWARQPAAVHVACTTGCASALAGAIEAGARLLVVDGDASIAGPAALGSADDPVAIAVSGTCDVNGPVSVSGVLHCGSLRWNDAAAPSAGARGAVVVAGDYAGNGAADFTHDAAVLARLQTRAGSFVRINGSWKDF